ncbi:MAG: hypothetical protein K2X39_10075 [Silvanigrellaceae bacterium]|nr:hypothetical protein [Silvanigrellaceae bacterium]
MRLNVTFFSLVSALSAIGFSSFYLASCNKGKKSSSSSSSSAADQFSGLNDMPSMNSVVASNSSGNAMARFYNAVVGTPPYLKDIKTDTDVDTYFYNGLIAQLQSAINTSTAPSASQVSDFFGNNTSSSTAPGGMGACSMAQAVAGNIGRLLEAGGSTCYMKGITNVSSGINITSNPNNISQSAIFKPSSSDKLVVVNISGIPGNGDSQPNSVHITVAGKDSLDSSTKYKATLVFCSSDNKVTQVEVDQVNTDSTFSVSTMQSDSFGIVRKLNVTGGLKVDSSGNIDFDPSISRAASAAETYGSSQFFGNLNISSDNVMTTKMLIKNSSGNYNFTNKLYAVLGFSGTGMSDLRFTQGAYKGKSVGGNFTSSFNGASYYNNTYYANDPSSPYKSQVDAESLDADSFFTSPTTPTVDLSSYRCSGTPDVELTMDFTNSKIQELQAKCDGQRLTNYNMCNSSSLLSVQYYIQQYQ